MRHIFPLSAFLLFLACCVGASTADRGSQFQVIVLHDVVDTRAELDADGITTSDLVSLLEWLRANHWMFLSLNDVEQARKSRSTLPDRAILITVDDGYLSEYTRIFPLLLAYKVPAVMALMGAWMDGTAASGKRQINWDQAREMQRSGLVEFASHSYDLHHAIVGNPQGNGVPAAVYRKYVPGTGYESDAAYGERIRVDLTRAADQMEKELGRRPRCLVWPYGQYTQEGDLIAHELGYTFTFTLDPSPAFVGEAGSMGRYYITTNNLLDAQRRPFQITLPPVQRLIHVKPADLWSADEGLADAKLGKAIERLRMLGATAVVVDAIEEDSNGRITGVWFPNSELPMRADYFLRVTLQLRQRAGVAVYGRMQVQETLEAVHGSADEVVSLCQEMATHGALDGMLFEHTPALAAIETEPSDSGGAPWQVRRRRDALDSSRLPFVDALTLRCFREVEAQRPGLKVALANPLSTGTVPSSIADITLVIVSDKPKQVANLGRLMQAKGWFEPIFARRFGLWIDTPSPPKAADLSGITRNFEVEGGAVIGWRTDDPLNDKPPAAKVAPSVSASIFPERF